MYTQHIIIDFEMNPIATGKIRVRNTTLGTEIIEIGAVKVNRDLEIADRFHCMVQPAYSSTVCPDIVRLTGIKNREIAQACSLAEALTLLSDWIGTEEKTRIYSWSNSDLNQLKKECRAKDIPFPETMQRWLDFQAFFPQLFGLGNRHRKVSLKDAATSYGLTFESKKAHRALYDAEITAELLLPVLDGSYRKQIELIQSYLKSEELTSSSLGDLFGGVFSQFREAV